MKHLNLLFAICASTALLSSCGKEKQETKRVSSVDWQNIVIKGTQEGSNLTKISVDGTTGKLYWSVGDAITVFLGTAGTKYIAQNTEKAATTTFVCSSPVVIGSTEGTGENLYGLYPFDSNATSDGPTITTTLPDTQKAAEGTFADSLFITVGKATISNPTMGFYNLCGGVRFTVTTEGITSVTFKGNNDEVLAGKVKLAVGNDNIPVVSEVVDGKKEITLTCAEGFKTGTMYYITTLPATLTKGYTVIFQTAGKTGTVTTDRQTAIKRSVFGTLENADEGAVWDSIVNIPDATFKAYCVANFDKDSDGEISYSEVADVDSITVDTKDIESMEGLEAFVNLKYLYCSLKVKRGSRIDGVWHYYDADGNEVSSKLTSLDVSKNTALIFLACSTNQLSSLDVSNNTALTTLYCYENQLTSLDVSKNTALTRLDCTCNQLSSLDVSKNTALTLFNCYENQLTSLDVSKNPALDNFFCNENRLTSLDISYNTAITRLNCSDNQLASLDVSNNTELTFLSCTGNQLTSLDVSKSTALTRLDCAANQLSNLDVSKNTALTSFDCHENQFASLDVSKNTELEFLSCYKNQLISLDVSNNTLLTILYCNNNPYLTEIWLKVGQTIKNQFLYDTDIAILKYKVDDGGGETLTFENW